MSEFCGEIRDFRRATTASFNALRQDFVDIRTHVDNGFTEMRGKFDADHGRVWTSTDITGGRSRTIGAQVSPASADA